MVEKLLQLNKKTNILIATIALFLGCEENKTIVKTDYFVNQFVKDTIIEEIDLVFIPNGPYKKGINCEEATINYNYWIGKYEITNIQFYNFLKIALKDNFITLEDSVLYYKYTGCKIIPANKYRVKMFDDKIYLENDSIKINQNYANHPVISVTWFGAKAFCNYYGFKLPSESEWEKAARGNHCIWFPWGNNIDSSFANFFNSKDPYEPGTTPVGFYNGFNYNGFQTTNSASVFGCFDMSGNAWEWTSDNWGKEVPFFKGKGGGFNYHTPAFLQIYYISMFGPHERPPLDMCDLPDGFRVVKK